MSEFIGWRCNTENDNDTFTNKLFLTATVLAFFAVPVFAADLPWVVVAKDQKGFVLEKQNRSFTPWGFNYDHDQKGRLIEDYWVTEWEKIERDFRSMKKLGANVVRIHLQLGKFMEETEKPNKKGLERLRRLIKLAEDVGLYLDLTGLGCYHKSDVPEWYDRLDERGRGTCRHGSGSTWRRLAKKAQPSSVTT